MCSIWAANQLLGVPENCNTQPVCHSQLTSSCQGDCEAQVMGLWVYQPVLLAHTHVKMCLVCTSELIMGIYL